MPHYVIYARKSSESEDRQVLSIDSQVRELSQHARSNNLVVDDVLSESRSAKAPGREVFGKLLTRVAEGNAEGIICWKLDRLARNPVDGGALIWALEESKVKEIITPQRTFSNTGSDKFWMQLEFGMAKKYVDDLSDNVKRGNRAKLEQGWLPGVPPLGYLNDLATKTIIPDPERFRLVRKMWELLLVGQTVSEVLRTANEVWGFRTRQFRRIGGKPLSRSALYRIFSNPFYYGLIIRNGRPYTGAHEAMVAKDDFDTVQRVLGRPQKHGNKKHQFAFTGIIRCGECGSAITAEEKVNRYGSHYIYYRCTKRRTGTSCGQKTIRVEELEKQIYGILHNIHLDDDVRDSALKYAEVARRNESATEAAVTDSLRKTYNSYDKQLNRLTDLQLRELLTDDEFTAKRNQLITKKLQLKEQLDDNRNRNAKWLEPIDQTIIFCNHAPKCFKSASLEEKREILLAVGSNFELRDRILRIDIQKPFEISTEGGKNRDWGGIVDKVRTFFMAHPHSIQWPKFCKDKRILRQLKKKTNNQKPG